jgi:hypothetical protein
VRCALRYPILALPWLAACGGATRDLGEDPLDEAVLADVPVLAPLAEALGDDGATVLDLFDEDLAFASAPDPTGPHQAEHDRQAALDPVTGEIPLRVLTFNTGLLDRGYLGGHVAVPEIEARRAVMADTLLSGGWDVLLLTEIWEWDDVEAIGAAAEDAGFDWYAGTERTHEETGLMLLVRSELVGATELQEEGQFDAQRKLENWPGPNLKRGWLHWQLTLAGSDAVIDLWVTHLTPFPDRWLTRNLQVRQLGLLARDVPDDHVVILGGDFNAGPYYASDTWVTGEDEEIGDWWANAVASPLIRHYAGLEDAHAAATGPLDKAAGDALPLDGGEALLDEPYGDASVCEGPGQDVYTATDCNSHYFASYAGTEFPARMDALFFRGGDRMRVDGAALVLTDDIEGEDFELSDHYGVATTFAVAP